MLQVFHIYCVLSQKKRIAPKVFTSKFVLEYIPMKDHGLKYWDGEYDGRSFYIYNFVEGKKKKSFG